MTADSAAAGLVAPGRGAGLLDVLRRRFLLKLLVRKELRVRYRGSVLGLAWSYVKPAVQFVVYYFVLGVFLQLNQAVDAFGVYLFCGIVLINFFGEAFGNATRSVVGNSPLVKKIYLPRELFPVASTIVALVHFVPQFVVLLLGAVITGYVPDPENVAAGLLGISIFVVLALGMGLLFAAVNVLFRDFENIVDLLLIVLTWASPVLYPWSTVRDAVGDGWLLQLYLANPLTIGVSLFQRAFWYPGTDGTFEFPPDLWLRGGASLLLAFGVLALGQVTFARLERRFAQEL